MYEDLIAVVVLCYDAYVPPFRAVWSSNVLFVWCLIDENFHAECCHENAVVVVEFL